MASRNNALVLVNLGSTAAAEAGAVRQYLNQFLMDRHVIDLPWPIRRAIVSLVLRRRPEESAAAYRSIWWQEGSPLLVISRRLQAQMTDHWKAGPVEVAMRYGEPSMEQVLCNLAGRGIRRITLAPLYPQFANSTVTTVREEARRVVKRRHLRVQLDVLAPFYDKPEYLSALAESIGPYLQQPYDHLLLSYHGLPERHIRKADPTGGHCLCNPECCRQASGAVLDRCYRAQCVSTSERLAATLGIPRKSWSMAFQSRLGRAKWIEPYTDAVLRELPRQGVRKLLVACPAFVADCIETLEEIGIRARRVFVEAGGEELTLIPCLNDQPFWAAALAAICRSASHKSLVTPIGDANH